MRDKKLIVTATAPGGEELCLEITAETFEAWRRGGFINYNPDNKTFTLPFTSTKKRIIIELNYSVSF